MMGGCYICELTTDLIRCPGCQRSACPTHRMQRKSDGTDVCDQCYVDKNGGDDIR